jgi:hypothetical protein
LLFVYHRPPPNAAAGAAHCHHISSNELLIAIILLFNLNKTHVIRPQPLQNLSQPSTTYTLKRAPKMFKFKSSSTTASTASTSTIPTPLKIANLILRFLQLVFAVTVIGLYSTDLDRARRRNVKANSRWVYAVVVGALSALTALLFMIPRVKFYRVFPWDGVLL